MKTLKEKIEVMQAALDGKTIQFSNGPLWIDCEPEHLIWQWPDYDYRIKPEPLEFWVLMVENSNTPSLVNESKEYLSQFRSGGKTIKVREVLDD